MRIICSKCGRDINAIGQDNMSHTDDPLCEDCAGFIPEDYDYDWTRIIQEENEQLRQENKSLRDRVFGLEEQLNKAKEYIEHEWFKRLQVGIYDKTFEEWQINETLQQELTTIKQEISDKNKILDKLNEGKLDIAICGLKYGKTFATVKQYIEIFDKFNIKDVSFHIVDSEYKQKIDKVKEYIREINERLDESKPTTIELEIILNNISSKLD